MNNYLTADEHVAAFFHAILEPVEVRDEKGNLLGHYTPHVPPELREAYARAASSFDLEEARRRLAAHKPGQGRTTEQVLARLRSLERGG
jgi:hypothetical protein